MHVANGKMLLYYLIQSLIICNFLRSLLPGLRSLMDLDTSITCKSLTVDPRYKGIMMGLSERLSPGLQVSSQLPSQLPATCKVLSVKCHQCCHGTPFLAAASNSTHSVSIALQQQHVGHLPLYPDMQSRCSLPGHINIQVVKTETKHKGMM